ncbi:MAG: hypothetical protein GTO24_10965 [candidate division Zixibacteria bacterium]|nr:hypothetical protein [candidate division Zixibacteria bacterium]
MTVVDVSHLRAFAPQNIRFVEEQDRITSGGTLKNVNEILFGLTDVFADDHQKTNPENRATLISGGLENCPEG